MTLLVKICGLTREADVEAAVEAGADAVGFVFHAASPRNVAPARAAKLAGILPARVRRVAVTMHPTMREVEGIFAAFMPDAWQTDAADFARFGLPAGVEPWPVLRSGRRTPPALPQLVLYDAAVSGQGMRADWRAASRLARRTRLIVGGGLDPGTVQRAIEAVRPAGVDVSSGVERSPGVKEASLIREFIAAARAGAGSAGA
ncbi:MAG TPA: phosphoribosylanthranilate isomerase [Steroidobacteraceae bacterium]|nr:phosphoribosylanthranilate isomerase [Steroidobacteraceae bacterium]